MVFSIDQLHEIRRLELEEAVALLPKGATVLEIGAGTGEQAKLLSESGFRMIALDLSRSNYSGDRVFPVFDYDGKTLPIESATIDVVFSSNVLEHVTDLPTMQAEIKRVLRPNGFAVHLMPSPSWRFWTTISGWLDIVPAAYQWSRSAQAANSPAAPGLLRLIAQRAIPRRHGEHGIALTELWTFSQRFWVRHFEAEGFVVESVQPTGLFYTGHMLLGRKLSARRRRRLSTWLGSACSVYKVRPRRHT